MKGLELKYNPRPLFAEEFVLVDGITRTGKFMLAHVVAALERVEFFQYPHLFETLLYLHRLGKIDFETCQELIHQDFNAHTFNLMIGRYLNTRESDLSNINKSAFAETYLARAKTDDRDLLEKQFLAQKRMPFFINHEGLANAGTLFRVFPKVKIVNILRDPIALTESWFRRGWGKRIGSDPKTGWVSFQHKLGPTPWWAVEWADEYHSLNEMERCLRSIDALSGMAKESFLALPKDKQDRVLFAEFERITKDPAPTISALEKFLGTERGPGLEAILRRERLPRAVPTGAMEEIYATVRGGIDPKLRSVFDKMADEYRSFWAPRSPS